VARLALRLALRLEFSLQNYLHFENPTFIGSKNTFQTTHINNHKNNNNNTMDEEYDVIVLGMFPVNLSRPFSNQLLTIPLQEPVCEDEYVAGRRKRTIETNCNLQRFN
jgi:hypothetical protein